ncbi:MAG: tyrosine-type recombinase/integrase [Bacillota bacterium]
MAHIQNVDGKFRAFVETGTGYNRKRRTKLFDTRQAAEDWMSRMLIDRNDGVITNPEKITFKNFATRWLENHKKPNIAASSYRGYKQQLDAYIIPFFEGMLLKDINVFHLENYFAKMRKNGKLRGEGGLSENTLNKHYVTLNCIFKLAIKPGIRIIKYNPLDAIQSPRPEKKETLAMPEKDYTKLLNTIKKEDIDYFTFILTLILTGMRRSEILGLEWEDVDLEAGTIKIRKRMIKAVDGYIHEEKTKTESSRRTIKLSDKLIPVLKEHKKRHMEYRLEFGPDYYTEKDFVFSRPDGECYYPNYLNQKFNKYLDRLGLNKKYNLHTLRHTFATISLQTGVDAKIVQEMLGHSTITTTRDIYSHVDLDMQKKALDKMSNAINFD